jgi:hypothetical protein
VLSGAVYAREVRIATFEFQKLVESGTSRFEERLMRPTFRSGYFGTKFRVPHSLLGTIGS